MDWVSTKDRMPEDGQNVIIFSEGHIDFGMYNKKLHLFVPNRFCSMGGVFPEEYVTYWMELPYFINNPGCDG